MEIEEYKRILKKMPRKEMEEFLIDKLITDISIRESFEINFTQYFPKKTKEDYKVLVKRALGNVADRDYISEENGRDALDVLYEYETKIEEFIKINEIEEALSIIEATLEIIGEFIIDGSYGEHGMIQDDFKEIMEKLLKKCSKKEKEKFLEWLRWYVKVDDEFIDFKDEFEKIIEYEENKQ